MSSARKLFVEGGGQNDALKAECRRAFRVLFEKAGLRDRLPRIVACGSRRNAYDQFCTALKSARPSDLAFLLVDSEGPVVASDPWKHVEVRSADQWQRPSGAGQEHLHLMVQCMESWFLADRATLHRFFGQGFQDSALPGASRAVEEVSKADLARGLERATHATATKGCYAKGRHSFAVLAELDVRQLRSASPWAERFFATLDRLLV